MPQEQRKARSEQGERQLSTIRATCYNQGGGDNMTKVFKRLAIVLAVVAALSMLAVGTTYAAGLGNGSSGDGVCDCVCDNQTQTQNQAGENGQYGNSEPGDCLCDNQTMTQRKAGEENGQNGAQASGDCVQQQTQATAGEENGQNSGAQSGDCALEQTQAGSENGQNGDGQSGDCVQLQTCQQDQEQTKLQTRACVDEG